MCHCSPVFEQLSVYINLPPTVALNLIAQSRTIKAKEEEKKMAAMVESWMSELGKWKNRVEAQKKKPLMPKSKLCQQRDLKESENNVVISADSDDREATLSDSTICLLIDRFAPL